MRKKTWEWRAMIFFIIMCAYVTRPQDASAEGQTGPAAVFPEMVFDFGVVLEGKEVTHDFIVQNRGSSELVIQNVKPG